MIIKLVATKTFNISYIQAKNTVVINNNYKIFPHLYSGVQMNGRNGRGHSCMITVLVG